MTASRPRFDSSINYYQVLDVPFGATKEEITRAYRQLMRITHPDNFQEPRDRAKAEERAKLINAAYSVLSKPAIRAEYDRQIRSTAMADVLMQRYTGGGPGRPAPSQARPRPPSPRVIRARKRAHRVAVLQLLLVTSAFAAAMMVVIVVLWLALGSLVAVVS